MVRDNFSSSVKDALAKRTNFRCSNPDCQAQTSGPKVDEQGILNIGVAAHICAAAEGGPRFDPDMSPKMRSSAENGIWLCQNCGKLIDNDKLSFTVEQLKSWKLDAENKARKELGKPVSPRSAEAGNPTLAALVERAIIKYVTPCEYWVQIDLRLSATGGDIYLSTLRIKGYKSDWLHQPDSLYGDEGMLISFLPAHQNRDLLVEKPEQLRSLLEQANQQGQKVRDLCLRQGAFLSTTLIGTLYAEQLMDGYEDFSLGGWSLIFRYNNERTLEVPLNFAIHRQSPKQPILWEFIGFNNELVPHE